MEEEITLERAEPLKVNFANKQDAKPNAKSIAKQKAQPIDDNDEGYNGLVSCLRNERIIVRFIPKKRGLVTDKRHVLYGGMSEKSVREYTVPVQNNGVFVNVLTNEEKSFLENMMGLEYNTLGVYGNSYWKNYKVVLHKYDTFLDLSDPEDYIKYKVLLANKDAICPSEDLLKSRPKATYRFVLIREVDKDKIKLDDMNATMKSYMELGRMQDDKHLLKAVVELVQGHPLAENTDVEYLLGKCHDLIKDNAAAFLKVASDKLLPTKSLIFRGIEAGVVSRKGDQYWMREDNVPLCGHNEQPTLEMAAAYLNLPKNQNTRLAIEVGVQKYEKNK